MAGKGHLLWITGLSGSGKSTLAKKIYEKNQNNTVIIDGDMFRDIIGDELGHSPKDRLINAWRIVKMCKFLCDQDKNVICATMSLYQEIHEYIYENFNNPSIIYLEVSLDVLKKRNQKGLYNDSQTNVIGLDLPFDKPDNEKYVITLNNENDLDKNVEFILGRLETWHS